MSEQPAKYRTKGSTTRNLDIGEQLGWGVEIIDKASGKSTLLRNVLSTVVVVASRRRAREMAPKYATAACRTRVRKLSILVSFAD